MTLVRTDGDEAPASTPFPRPVRGAARRRLEEMLRVDHAGELGAVHIYRGQRAVLKGGGPRDLDAQLEEMEAHEAAHLAAFDAILTERQIRPTVLAPLWRIAGFALGAGTALMGPRLAHACTEAVETVIEGHYAEQIEVVRREDPALAASLEGFRDDELRHRDIARDAGARDAPGYPLLAAVISVGCRAAIKISEKL